MDSSQLKLELELELNSTESQLKVNSNFNHILFKYGESVKVYMLTFVHNADVNNANNKHQQQCWQQLSWSDKWLVIAQLIAVLKKDFTIFEILFLYESKNIPWSRSLIVNWCAFNRSLLVTLIYRSGLDLTGDNICTSFYIVTTRLFALDLSGSFLWLA